MPKVNPKVKLVNYTKNPEKLIADSARLCYASNEENIANLFNDNKIDPKDDARMVRFLSSNRHLSPLEHASFNFYIEGVSRALTHQLVRHRIASYSQRSQRYVSHQDFDYIIPPSFLEANLEEDYVNVMESINKSYKDLSEKLNKKLNLSSEELNQDARYILPNACETKILVTMNSRSLLNFFSERLCNRSQWEIRTTANKMRDLVLPIAPNLFSPSGPKCYSQGKCYEGKYGCGKSKEVKEFFSKKSPTYKP